MAYTNLNRRRIAALAARPATAAPPAYRERMARMQNEDARARTWSGLLLLGELLAGAGYSAGEIERIGFGAYGRPRIAGLPCFSISHSHDLVACALSGHGRIGLDVERRRMELPGRLQRVLNQWERAEVAACPTRFYDCWSAREATIKASGRAGLERLRGQTRFAAGHSRLDGIDWYLRPLELRPDYAGCLACEHAIGELRVMEIFIDRG